MVKLVCGDNLETSDMKQYVTSSKEKAIAKAKRWSAKGSRVWVIASTVWHDSPGLHYYVEDSCPFVRNSEVVVFTIAPYGAKA